MCIVQHKTKQKTKMKTIERSAASPSDPNSEGMKNRYPDYQQLDITALDELPLEDVLALHPDVTIPDYVPESLKTDRKSPGKGINPDFLKFLQELENPIPEKEPFWDKARRAKAIGLLGGSVISLVQLSGVTAEAAIEPIAIPESSISVISDSISAEQLNILDELDIMAVETDEGIKLVPKPGAKQDQPIQLDMLEEELGIKLERVNKVAGHRPDDISDLEHPDESEDPKHAMEFIQEDLFDLVPTQEKKKKKSANSDDETKSV